MRRLVETILLATLLHGTCANAVPILSVDGSTLTSLDVDGTLYNVTFGDGIIGDVYSSIVFDFERETEANSVSLALISYFRSSSVVGSSISGCMRSLRGRCFLINPDGFDTVFYRDIGAANYDSAGQGTWEGGGLFAPYPLIDVDSDTSQNPIYTLVKYAVQPAFPVPTPAPLFLIGLSLVLLRASWRTEKQEKPGQIYFR